MTYKLYNLKVFFKQILKCAIQNKFLDMKVIVLKSIMD